MVVLGTLVFILALIYGVLVALGRARGAGPVLLQHAGRVGRDRHPVRAAARRASRPRSTAGCSRRSTSCRGASRRCAPSWPTSSTCAMLVPRVLVGARGVAARHPRLDLPGRSRRVGLRARRATSGRGPRRASTPSPTARSSSACAAPASSPSKGIERELAARRTGLERGAREPAADAAHARADERLGRPGVHRGEDQLLGALVLRDERLREAYSSDEIELFRGVATSIGVTLQNSQVYERVKERDRLAALGEMAAGLAHEIRNPLGAIKGAAQLLQPGPGAAGRRRERDAEFLDIIVEEVEPAEQRRDAVPRLRAPLPRRRSGRLDLNDVVRKTVQLLRQERGPAKVEIVTDSPSSCRRCAAIAEQLLQVFLNLLAATRCRRCPRAARSDVSTRAAAVDAPGAAAAFVEVRFRDTGVGIPRGRSQEPVHPVLHDQGEGHRPRPGDQPAHHRAPRRHHRGALADRGRARRSRCSCRCEADAYAAYAGGQARAAEAARRAAARPPPLPPPPGRVTAARRSCGPARRCHRRRSTGVDCPAVTAAAATEAKRVLVADDELNMRRVLEAMLAPRRLRGRHRGQRRRGAGRHEPRRRHRHHRSQDARARRHGAAASGCRPTTPTCRSS